MKMTVEELQKLLRTAKGPSWYTLRVNGDIIEQGIYNGDPLRLVTVAGKQFNMADRIEIELT